MDDYLKKSVSDAEKLRSQLPKLREDPSVDGMIKYNETLLEAVERQHNIYTRLRLMGDPESVQVADEMEHVSFTHLGRPEDLSMSDFFTLMKEEIIMQLGLLTPGRFHFDEGPIDGDDWSWT
jgi:hypothetical protein